MDRLNFRSMVWVLGNHDKGDMQQEATDRPLKVCRYMEVVTVEDYSITLCHYSMRKWNKAHYGTWHLYGHSHGNLPPYGLSMDVGVDAHNFYPVEFSEIKNFMNSRLQSNDYHDLGLVKPIARFD
jgi:calcineurin-like phosphoesterase family protein